jgi:hypothetical protein
MPPIRPNAAPSFTVVPDAKTGLLQGTAAPGTVVEVVNLSTAAVQEKKVTDTFSVATADASGNFKGALPDLKGGDVLRLRTRDGSGRVGNWLTLRAGGDVDTRPAQVNVGHLAMQDLGNGKVSIGQKDAAFPVGEPGAYVEIKNLRSGETALMELDGDGNIPAGQSIKGVPADTFSIAASDGTHNDALTEEAGRITLPGHRPVVDLPDPAVHSKYNQANSSGVSPKQRFTGPLFVDGVSSDDVKQGYLGDCYLCAAAAGLAARHPAELQKAFADNGDGTFTVTFRTYDAATRSFKPTPVTVDGELYTGYGGSPLYMSSTGDRTPGKMELWPAILEKAWAAYKGSYDKMGSGGQACDVMSAILGKPAHNSAIKNQPALAWQLMQTAVAKKQASVATTRPESEAALFTNTGVHADHGYTVMDAQVKDGVKLVTLRNPWGHGEPTGNGTDDGVFTMKFADFMKLFTAVHTFN